MTSPLRIGTSVTSDESLKVAVLRGLNLIVVGSVGCKNNFEVESRLFCLKNMRLKFENVSLTIS